MIVIYCDILWSRTGHGWFQDHCCWKIWMSWKLLWCWASKTASTFEGLQDWSDVAREFEFMSFALRLILHVDGWPLLNHVCTENYICSECSLSLSLRWRPIFLAFSCFFYRVRGFINLFQDQNQLQKLFWQAGSGSYLIRPRTRFEITKLMLGLADLFRPVLLSHPWKIVLLPTVTPVWSKFRVLFPLENRLTIFTLKSILHPQKRHVRRYSSPWIELMHCSFIWLKYLDHPGASFTSDTADCTSVVILLSFVAISRTSVGQLSAAN